MATKVDKLSVEDPVKKKAIEKAEMDEAERYLMG